MKVSDQDLIFISYDEPNAEINYANLLNKAPWAKRVHGVKGSDAAHKAAAEMSETEWFITVDGDNIVYENFFDIEIEEITGIHVYSWCGRNSINNLTYGNGGLKIWKRDFVLNMKTHESSDSDKAQVDFCWEDGYRNFPTVFSDTVINTTPFQAWRAGFREGVKMLLKDGLKVDKDKIKNEIYWHNLHRLRMWSCVGAHVPNGLYAMLGARMGSWMTYCTDWNHIDVRDFDVLKDIYDKNVNHTTVEQDVQELGVKLKQQLGLNWAFFDSSESQYICEMYEEAIAMGQTYYNKAPIWKSSF
jgi:hypothetical protein